MDTKSRTESKRKETNDLKEETEGSQEIMCQVFEDLAEKRADERAMEEFL